MNRAVATCWMLAVACAAAIGGCASTPPVPAQPTALPNGVTPQQMVASIHAAAEGSAAELQVQPLRDPQVEDLRQDAATLQAQGQHQEAAALLQQAMEITPDDPALLQEAAEAAVLLWQFDQAEQLARRAHELGSQVGPLCRRHWATVEQVAEARLALASAPDSGAATAPTDVAARAQQARLVAAGARQARDACTVAAPQRY